MENKQSVMSDTVLIVDRDTAELRKLRELLTREGFSVMTATDIQTAKQICEQIPVKFVLGESVILGYTRKS